MGYPLSVSPKGDRLRRGLDYWEWAGTVEVGIIIKPGTEFTRIALRSLKVRSCG